MTVEAYSKAQLPAERIDEEVRVLQEELRTLRADSVEAISEPAPPGSKSGEALTVGSFLVAVAPELLKEALTIVIEWLRRDPSRVIKIRQTTGGPEYEVTGHWKAADLAEMMKVLAKQEANSSRLP